MDEMGYDIYAHYLSKFEDLFGPLNVGEVAQHQGRLIQKLSYDEFAKRWKEYKQLDDYLCEVMSTGATLNDDIYRNYLELTAQVLESPKDFMTL
jgi:hypothetical protein